MYGHSYSHLHVKLKMGMAAWGWLVCDRLPCIGNCPCIIGSRTPVAGFEYSFHELFYLVVGASSHPPFKRGGAHDLQVKGVVGL